MAELKAQIAALTGSVDSVQTQADEIGKFVYKIYVPFQQINNNTANIATNATAITANTTAINDLTNDLQENLDLANYLDVNTDEDAVRFIGANVYVVNGMGTTNTTNSLGNLIVGYNAMPAGVLNAARDGSHNVIIGDGHEYGEHSELETTSIASAHAPLNILSASNIGLVSGDDFDVDVGNNANFVVGRNANVAIGDTANLNVGNIANFLVGNDVNLNAGSDASFQIGQTLNLAMKDLNLDITGDANLDLQDLFLNARYVGFVTGSNLTFDVGGEATIVTDNKILIKAGGDLILKGSRILEN